MLWAFVQPVLAPLSPQEGGAPLLQHPQKVLDRAVVSCFDIVRKITGRKLGHAAVIGDALAAQAFSAAGIRTVAVLSVFLL